MEIKHEYQRVDDISSLFEDKSWDREVELEVTVSGLVPIRSERDHNIYYGVLSRNDTIIPFAYHSRYGQINLVLLKAASENKDKPCIVQGIVKSRGGSFPTNYILVERVKYGNLEAKLPDFRMTDCL